MSHVLNYHGKKAKALGNVGVPLTGELEEISPDTIIVAELSSYQLETMHSKIIDAGVILNITPDHLDRYKTMEKYAEAKFLMQDCMKPHARLYVEETALKEYGYLLKTSAKQYGYSFHCEIYTDKEKVYDGKTSILLAFSFKGTGQS